MVQNRTNIFHTRTRVQKNILVQLLFVTVIIIQFACHQNQNKNTTERFFAAQNDSEQNQYIQRIAAKPALCNYYESADFQLTWLDEKGQLNENGSSLVKRIRKLHLEGLDGTWYYMKEIDELISSSSNLMMVEKSSCAFIDILLTDAFLNICLDHYAGRTLGTPYFSAPVKSLSSVSPLDSLQRLIHHLPVDSIINKFKCSYREYRALEIKLRQFYDSMPGTDSILTAKIQQVKLNMERWRWMPRKEPNQALMVNTAAFRLWMRMKVKDTLAMKIIVGKTNQPTPMLQSNLRYIILNPWWEVPHSIASKEILAELQKDRYYLSKNHMKIYRFSDGSEILHPERIRWHRYTEKKFNFRVRQTPGEWNALGRIKFIFPNYYSVYLHDTPYKNLFTEDVRTFSHGCMRIEHPLPLAAYLLHRKQKSIQEQIDSGQETYLFLPEAVPVFVSYLSAWLDDSGELHLEKDVYGYDEALNRKLNDVAGKRTSMM